MGKTTGVIRALPPGAPAVIYSPCNEEGHAIRAFPAIEDTPIYLSAGLEPYFKQSPQFVCRHKGNTPAFVDACCALHGKIIVLDDMATLFSDAEEKAVLKRLIPLVGYQGCTLIGVAHLPYSDTLKKFRVSAGSIYWYGPIHDDAAINDLWELRRVDVTRPEFETRLKTLQQYEYFQIR